MLTLGLTLILSAIHLPAPSSLHLIEAQVDAPIAAQPEATRARLFEIEKELSSIRTTWPSGSVVFMAVGFGGAVTFSLAGLVLVIGGAMSGIAGVLVLSVGLLTGGLTLLLGIAGVIWGATQAGASRNRARRLEDERALLLREADGRPQLALPRLITLATF